MLNPDLAFIVSTSSTSLMTLRSMLQLSFASQFTFCAYLTLWSLIRGHFYVVHMLIL